MSIFTEARQHARTPGWVKRVHWLWRQDDADDTPEKAWQRLHHEELSSVRFLDSYDDGDGFYWIDQRGYVYLCSYPSNERIGLVRGPFAAVP